MADELRDAVPAPESPTPRADATDGATSPRRRRFPVRAAVIAGIALLVVLLLVLPVFSTLQPGYYERYPTLRTRMANWATSTHTKVSCADCHVDPGIGGFLSFAARSVPAFYSQLVFGPSSTNLLSVPSAAACEKCHTIYRQVSPGGDLLIPHRAHVEVLGIKCAVCHKNLVHSLNTRGYNRPEMSTCLKLCHDGEQATAECVKCHTQKQVPESHKAASWIDSHGTQTDTAKCGTCHGYQPDYCQTTCHRQLPPSHTGNFKQTHAQRVAARGTKGCDFCHGGQTFCKECH
jgi:hypothetical protein